MFAQDSIHRTEPVNLSALGNVQMEPESGFALLGLHLTRLEQSARFFDFRFSRDQALSALHAAVQNVARLAMKVRLSLSISGHFTVNATPLESDPLPVPALVRVADSPVDREEVKLFHKTTDRELYPPSAWLPAPLL